MRWYALGQVGRCDRQQARGDGQSHEGIVAASLESEGGHQRQTDQNNTDAGQQMKRRHFVGGARQSTELTRNRPWHWLHGLSCGADLRKAPLAGANPPARKRTNTPASSSCRPRKGPMSSTSK